MNEIMKNIKRTIVDPEIKNIKTSTIGYVTAINESKQTADVLMIERDGNKRRKNNLSFPRTANGLITQSLKSGDKVEIGYRNSNFNSSYIIRLYEKNSNEKKINHGQQLPDFVDLF